MLFYLAIIKIRTDLNLTNLNNFHLGIFGDGSDQTSFVNFKGQFIKSMHKIDRRTNYQKSIGTKSIKKFKTITRSKGDILESILITTEKINLKFRVISQMYIIITTDALQ